jgi:DNA-binding MarR family transcriptional regulator
MQSNTLTERRPADAPAGGTAAATPFVDDYLAALLAQASHLISSEFHAVVREEGLAISEWRVLATLADGPPMSIGRLARIALAKQPTVTRLLDRMQEKGHVRRSAHGSDRRVTLVGITPAGRRVVDRLIVLAREHEERVLAPFGLARADALKTTLRRIIDLHKPSSETD